MVKNPMMPTVSPPTAAADAQDPPGTPDQPARLATAAVATSAGPFATGPHTRGGLARLGHDTAFLLAALPVAIASFTVLVTGLSLAAGLLITVIGVPIAVATLAAASGFASLERWRLGVRGTPLTPTRRAAGLGLPGGLRGMLALLRDRDRWAAVAHGISVLALSVLTFSVAVTWWVGALAGLSFWLWSRWLPESSPDESTSLAELVNLPSSDSALNLALGLVFAATLVPVVRGCAKLHELWARALLSGSSRRALEERVEDLTERRVAAASAEVAALRRFERDLHDGPQQRLVRLGMDLSVAERRLDDDPAAARELLGQARTQATEALAELRALSRGIAPPILSDRGLEAALAAVTARTPFPTVLDVDLDTGSRPAAAIENAAYYAVCEALTNVTKHAAASSAAVRIRRTAGTDGAAMLRVEVEDDGAGGADLAKGHGLVGLADRVAGLDGTLTLWSPTGGPTRLLVELPC